MTQLSSFSDADAELIVSLPYRAGLYVSYADDEDGKRDDELEMRAMQACLNEVSKMHEEQALTSEIAASILSRQDQWDAWSQGVFQIEPLCEKTILALKTQATDEEVKDYIKLILELSSAVAQAYGEFGEDPAPEKGFFGKAMSKIVGGFSGMSSDDINHPMNVSAAEDSAIARIAGALRKNK